MATVLEWKKTKVALTQLESLLICSMCNEMYKDPCSISSCDHTFCRVCATKAVNENSKCPMCGSFAWMKDLQTNRELASAVEFCLSLQKVVSGEDDCDDGCEKNSAKINDDPVVEQNANEERGQITNTNMNDDPMMEQNCNEEKGPITDTSIGQSNNDNPNCDKQELLSATNTNFNDCEDIDMQDLGELDEAKNSSSVENCANGRSQENDPDLLNSKVQESNESSFNAEQQSWPLFGVKPKKSLKTYSKRQKKAPTLSNINSNNDLNLPTDKSKKAGPGNSDGNSKDLYVYDEDLILEVEEKFFREDDEIGDNDDDDDDEHGDNNNNNADFCDNKLSSNKTENKKSGARLRTRRNQEEIVRDAGKAKQSKSPKEKIETKHTGQAQNSDAAKGSTNKSCKKKSTSPTASVMKRNKKGETPLHVAAIKGKYEQVKDLLENDADPNAKDFAGWTPLHEACNHGCLEIVQLLLDNGAFIDIPGCDHDTPLHDAIANNRLEVAEFLVLKGASLDVRNKQGLLPMDYVKSNAVREQLLLAATMAQENKSADANRISLKVHADRPKRILYTGLDSKEKKLLEKCSKNLNAKLCDEFDDEVTHIVAAVDTNMNCNRTMKYLLGVLTGKWIVSFQWISDSLKKQKWLNEEPYEVKGNANNVEGIPIKSRINAAKQFPRLFDGCSFFFSGDFKSHPTKPEMLQIIKLGGGTILHREPKVETSHPLITESSPAVLKIMATKSVDAPVVAYHAKPDTAQSHCTQYIIFDPETCPNHKRLSTPIMCTAPSTWLLDCISKFEIIEVRDC